jgi:hypothetical protein
LLLRCSNAPDVSSRTRSLLCSVLLNRYARFSIGRGPSPVITCFAVTMITWLFSVCIKKPVPIGVGVGVGAVVSMDTTAFSNSPGIGEVIFPSGAEPRPTSISPFLSGLTVGVGVFARVGIGAGGEAAVGIGDPSASLYSLPNRHLNRKHAIDQEGADQEPSHRPTDELHHSRKADLAYKRNKLNANGKVQCRNAPALFHASL